MGKKIRIGMLGAAHMHIERIKTLRKFPDIFEIVGIAEDNPQRLAAAKNMEMFRGLPWMTSEALLADPGLEAVMVESEEHELLTDAMRCIKAGKHIAMDKPAGESLSAFKELLDEAEKRSLVVQVGYMYRYNSAIKFCLDSVQEGLLGEIFAVDAVMNRWDPDDFRRIMKTFEGGVTFIFSCHLIDLMVILLGKPDSITSFPCYSRNDGVLDNSLTVMRYPRCIATARTSITEAGGFQRRFLTVCGDKGTITVQPLEIAPGKAAGSVTLTLTEDRMGWKKGARTIDLPPAKDRYDDQFMDFAAIVRGEKENPYSYSHELLVQQYLLEACGLSGIV